MSSDTALAAGATAPGFRHVLAAGLAGLIFPLTACERSSEYEAAGPQAENAPGLSEPATASFLDPAKRSSKDCGTVASYYAQALRSDLYDAAASVWAPDHGVTASGLRAQFRNTDRATMRVEDVQVEGAAGSLYCAVTVRVTRDSKPVRGIVTLRRVNDVPGATPEQLLWHIEQSTLN